MFGVFSGQVADFIDGEVASNRIQNAASLAGFSVGVLEKTRFLNLQTKFGFSPKFCAELDECLIALKTDEVQALLVPRADAISHFRTRQFGDSLSTISRKCAAHPFVSQGNRYHRKICSRLDQRCASALLASLSIRQTTLPKLSTPRLR